MPDEVPVGGGEGDDVPLDDVPVGGGEGGGGGGDDDEPDDVPEPPDDVPVGGGDGDDVPPDVLCGSGEGGGGEGSVSHLARHVRRRSAHVCVHSTPQLLRRRLALPCVMSATLSSFASCS